jgi:hypothetical protein
MDSYLLIHKNLGNSLYSLRLIVIENLSIQEKNKELMITLDNAWNTQDWNTFNERHADNVAVFWPGQPDPTRGVHNHRQESIEFFKMFPDNHIYQQSLQDAHCGRRLYMLSSRFHRYV